MPSSRWPTQGKLKVIFGGSLSHVLLKVFFVWLFSLLLFCSVLFFNLTNFLYTHYNSWLCALRRFLGVQTHVSLCLHVDLILFLLFFYLFVSFYFSLHLLYLIIIIYMSVCFLMRSTRGMNTTLWGKDKSLGGVGGGKIMIKYIVWKFLLGIKINE